jgi:hypothetical protein
MPISAGGVGTDREAAVVIHGEEPKRKWSPYY